MPSIAFPLGLSPSHGLSLKGMFQRSFVLFGGQDVASPEPGGIRIVDREPFRAPQDDLIQDFGACDP